MKNNNFKNDVIELYKKGLKPKTIANELAAKYNINTHSERAFKNFKSRIRTCISRFNHSKDATTVKEIDLDEIVREWDKMVRESSETMNISGKTEGYDDIKPEKGESLLIPVSCKRSFIFKMQQNKIKKLKLENKILKADIKDLNRVISLMVQTAEVLNDELRNQSADIVKEIIGYIPGYFATTKEVNEHTLCDFLNNLLDECQGE